MEDDVQLPLLTPNSMLTINPSYLPEEALWNRWSREYVRSLREQRRRAGGEQTPYPTVGDVVIIKGEKKNGNTWKLGIIIELIMEEMG